MFSGDPTSVLNGVVVGSLHVATYVGPLVHVLFSFIKARVYSEGLEFGSRQPLPVGGGWSLMVVGG